MNVFKKEIPKCFHPDLVFATALVFNREKTIVLLLKNCVFHEVRNLILLWSIDLKNHIVSNLPNNPLYLDDDINRKSQDLFVAEKLDQTEYHNSQNISISMGKFVLYHGKIRKLFILLKIEQQLIILERTNHGFILTKMFNQVEKYEILDPDNTYQANIYIHLVGSEESIKVVFDDCDDDESGKLAGDNFQNKDQIKNLVNDIRKARCEYAMEKIKTKKEFLKFKSSEMFGSNLVRSHILAEKQIISRLGDIWMKIHNECLIIGIPIANNCSERLTTVQNLKPILVCSNGQGIEFTYNLYEYKAESSLSDLNKLEAIKTAQEQQITLNSNFNEEWIPNYTRNFRPESFGVVTICMPICNLHSCIMPEFLCFINYEISISEKHTERHHLFIKKLSIDSEILYNKKFQLDFNDDREEAMNFLTIAETSIKHIFNIEAEALDLFLNNLYEILLNQLKLKLLNENSDQMETTDFKELSGENMVRIYQSQQSNNFWYGTIIKLSIPNYTDNKMKMKIYASTESKIIALIEIIFKNYNGKLKIIPQLHDDNNGDSLSDLETALRSEIDFGVKISLEMSKNDNDLENKFVNQQKTLFMKEFETDIAISSLDLMNN